MSVNRCLLVGTISKYGVQLRYLPSGKGEVSFTLVTEKSVGTNVFKTHIPVQVYGGQVEQLAETLEANDVVLVDGAIGYKSDRGSKEKQPITFAVCCFGVEIIQRATDSSAAAEERG